MFLLNQDKASIYNSNYIAVIYTKDKSIIASSGVSKNTLGEYETKQDALAALKFIYEEMTNDKKGIIIPTLAEMKNRRAQDGTMH